MIDVPDPLGALVALHVNERLRLEPMIGAVRASRAPVIAVGEDRHRVLNPRTRVALDNDQTSSELIREASYRTWDLGRVLARKVDEQTIFEVIVYDLDQHPLTTPQTVVGGLHALMDAFHREQCLTAAIEPIGVAHGGISPDEFAAVLLEAAEYAPIGLHLLICDADHRNLSAIFEELGRLIAHPPTEMDDSNV